MAGVAAVSPKFQFHNSAGGSLPNGTVDVYLAGTVTRSPSWQDQAQGTLNANPIALDARGEALIWLDPALTYDLVVKNSAAVTQYTVEDVTGSGNLSALMFLQAGTNAVSRAAQGKMREERSVPDYTGADSTGAADSLAAFNSAATAAGTDGVVVIPAGTWNLSANPSNANDITWFVPAVASFTGAGEIRGHMVKVGPIADTWVNDVSSGVYEYMETSTALNVFGKPDGLGVVAFTRSSTGAGGAGDANLGVSAFGYNDKTTGTAGVWGMYSTVLRAATVSGPTHGMEIDIGNAGATVAIYPAAMFPAGQTDALWVCSGGESTATAGLVGDASCAIGIVSNDSALAAQFDKGIVFHNSAIVGANGTGGANLGCAIAFAPGHQQIWFNNSNQATGEIVSTNVTLATSQRLDLSAFGLLVVDRVSGATQFQVEYASNPANYFTVVAGATPSLTVNGTGTNVDLQLAPKGTGVLKASYGSTAATVAANFVAARYLGFKDSNNTLWYLPIATATW